VFRTTAGTLIRRCWAGFSRTAGAWFFLDAIAAKREAAEVMRRLAIALSPVLVAAFAFGCADDPEEPNAFQTQGNNDASNNEESDTAAPLEDLPSDPTTGDGDGDPTTGDGDGDGDPTTGDGDGAPASCGNGVVDDGEQCDGGNLNGLSCIDLGYGGGTLACDPQTCTYDASGCTNTTDGGGGGTTG
jgi:hypothetical protein